MDLTVESSPYERSTLSLTVAANVVNGSDQRERLEASEEDANTNPYAPDDRTPEEGLGGAGEPADHDEDPGPPSDTSSSLNEQAEERGESDGHASAGAAHPYVRPVEKELATTRPTNQYRDAAGAEESNHTSSIQDSTAYTSFGTNGAGNAHPHSNGFHSSSASPNMSSAFPENVSQMMAVMAMTNGAAIHSTSVGGAVPQQVRAVGGPGGPGRVAHPVDAPNTGGLVASPMPSAPYTADSSDFARQQQRQHPHTKPQEEEEEEEPAPGHHADEGHTAGEHPSWSHGGGAANPAPRSMSPEEYYGGASVETGAGGGRPQAHLHTPPAHAVATAEHRGTPPPPPPPAAAYPPNSLEARRRPPREKHVAPPPPPQPQPQPQPRTPVERGAPWTPPAAHAGRRRSREERDAPHAGAVDPHGSKADDNNDDDAYSYSYPSDYDSYYYYYSDEDGSDAEYEYYEEFFDEEVEEDEAEDEEPRIDMIEGDGHGRTMHDILYGTPKAGLGKRGGERVGFVEDKEGGPRDDPSDRRGGGRRRGRGGAGHGAAGKVVLLDIDSEDDRASTPERYGGTKRKAGDGRGRRHPIEADIALDRAEHRRTAAAAKKGKAGRKDAYGTAGDPTDLDHVPPSIDKDAGDRHEPVTATGRTRATDSDAESGRSDGSEDGKCHDADEDVDSSADGEFSQPSRGAHRRRELRRKKARTAAAEGDGEPGSTPSTHGQAGASAGKKRAAVDDAAVSEATRTGLEELPAAAATPRAHQPDHEDEEGRAPGHDADAEEEDGKAAKSHTAPAAASGDKEDADTGKSAADSHGGSADKDGGEGEPKPPSDKATDPEKDTIATEHAVDHGDKAGEDAEAKGKKKSIGSAILSFLHLGKKKKDTKSDAKSDAKASGENGKSEKDGKDKGAKKFPASLFSCCGGKDSVAEKKKPEDAKSGKDDEQLSAAKHSASVDKVSLTNEKTDKTDKRLDSNPSSEDGSDHHRGDASAPPANGVHGDSEKREKPEAGQDAKPASVGSQNRDGEKSNATRPNALSDTSGSIVIDSSHQAERKQHAKRDPSTSRSSEGEAEAKGGEAYQPSIDKEDHEDDRAVESEKAHPKASPHEDKQKAPTPREVNGSHQRHHGKKDGDKPAKRDKKRRRKVH